MVMVICLICSSLFVSAIVPIVHGQIQSQPETPRLTNVIPEDSQSNVGISNIRTRGLCRDGWSPGTIQDFSGKTISICLKINPQMQTWKEAQASCRKDYGFLMKLDSKAKLNGVDLLRSVLADGITKFWTGIHTNNEHLVWDDLIPNQVRPHNRPNDTSIPSRPWRWNTSPLEDRTNYCGQININSDDDRRRRKRAADSDDSDFFENIDHNFPATSQFQSMLTRTQMSDQLAELPSTSDGIQSEHQVPGLGISDSNLQPGGLATDSNNIVVPTTAESDGDSASSFGRSGNTATTDATNHATFGNSQDVTPSVDLVSSVRDAAERIGMQGVLPSPSPTEALDTLRDHFREHNDRLSSQLDLNTGSFSDQTTVPSASGFFGNTFPPISPNPTLNTEFIDTARYISRSPINGDTGSISDILDTAKDVPSSSQNGDTGSISDMLDTAKDVLSSLQNGDTSSISDMVDTAKDVMSSSQKGDTGSISDMVDTAKEVLSSSQNGDTDSISDIVDTAKDVMSSSQKGDTGSISDMLETAKDVLVAPQTGDTGDISDMLDTAKDISSFSQKGDTRGISDMVDTAKDVLSSIDDKSFDINTPEEAAIDTLPDLSKNVQPESVSPLNIGDFLDNANDALEKLKDKQSDVQSTLSDIKDNVDNTPELPSTDDSILPEKQITETGMNDKTGFQPVFESVPEAAEVMNDVIDDIIPDNVDNSVPEVPLATETDEVGTSTTDHSFKNKVHFQPDFTSLSDTDDTIGNVTNDATPDDINESTGKQGDAIPNLYNPSILTDSESSNKTIDNLEDTVEDSPVSDIVETIKDKISDIHDDSGVSSFPNTEFAETINENIQENQNSISESISEGNVDSILPETTSTDSLDDHDNTVNNSTNISISKIADTFSDYLEKTHSVPERDDTNALDDILDDVVENNSSESKNEIIEDLNETPDAIDESKGSYLNNESFDDIETTNNKSRSTGLITDFRDDLDDFKPNNGQLSKIDDINEKDDIIENFDDKINTTDKFDGIKDMIADRAEVFSDLTGDSDEMTDDTLAENNNESVTEIKLPEIENRIDSDDEHDNKTDDTDDKVQSSEDMREDISTDTNDILENIISNRSTIIPDAADDDLDDNNEREIGKKNVVIENDDVLETILSKDNTATISSMNSLDNDDNDDTVDDDTTADYPASNKNRVQNNISVDAGDDDQINVEREDDTLEIESETGTSTSGMVVSDLPNLSEIVEELDEKTALVPSVTSKNMELSSCMVKLPSVCFSYEVEVMDTASTCEDGWYGHVLLDSCYKILDGKTTYRQAVTDCQSLNARVVLGQSQFQREFVLIAIFKEGKLFRGEKFWMEAQNEKMGCNYFDERGVGTVPSCSSMLRVACVKDAKSLSVYTSSDSIFTGDRVTDDYDYETQEMVFSSKGQTNILQCDLTSAASEFPVMWFKDGVLVETKDKYLSSDISLHLNDALIDAMGTVTNRNISMPALQGKYWCEVWDRKSLMRKRSRSLNVRFTDILSFHGSIELTSFDTKDVVLFNMMNEKFPTLSNTDIDLKTVFNDVLPALQSRAKDVTDVFTFVDKIRSRPSVLEYHTYFTLNRDYTYIDEDTIYNRLKGILRAKLGNKVYMAKLPGGTPLSTFKTMSLQSTVSCPAATLQTDKDLYGHKIPVRMFHFPKVLLGQFANSEDNCSVTNTLPAGTARCLGDFYTGAYWGDVIANECLDEIQMDSFNNEIWGSSPFTDQLTKMSETSVDTKNVEELVAEVAHITKVAAKFTPTDINKIADVLDHSTQVTKLSPKVGDDILKTVDKLMTTSDRETHVANVETKAANRIIKSLERYAENANLGNKNKMRMVTDNVVVEIWDLSQNTQPVIGLAAGSGAMSVTSPFSNESIATLYNKSQLINADVDAAIELPTEVFSKTEKGQSISNRLTMMVFRKSKLFQSAVSSDGRKLNPTDQQLSNLNSYVISASIAGKKLQGLKEKVKTIFKPIKASNNSKTCVWWDFDMNNMKGGWSSQGCHYDGRVNGRDVCLCDHLTNFAVLLDFYGQKKLIPDHHELSLSIITVLGLSCSILGLSLTIISYVFFRKLRQGRAQQTLFNLSLALLLSMLVFLIGIKQTHNFWGCVIVAVLLHYFILVSFMWMLMEAILQYLTFVKILGTYITRFTLKTVLPAWGLPLIPVIAVLSVDYNLYKGGPNYCWMDLPAFYFAFAVPITCIIMVNIIIFFITVISIFRRGKGLRSNQKKQKMAMTNLQAALTSFILLGLTWVFGYLAISDARLPFQYVFTILNSLQGFFIFILFVARKKKVRDQWYIVCCKGGEKDRVSRSLSASNSIPSSYSNGSNRNSRNDKHERDRSDSTKTVQSNFSSTSNGFTNFGYDNCYDHPYIRGNRRTFRKF